jgi:hypothetical protein
MAGTLKRLFGPVTLSTTLTTNIYNGAGGSALLYDGLKQINVTNRTGSAATFTIYLGATGANAAGTEQFVAVSVPANTTSSYTFYPALRLASTDFLVGGSGTLNALTITGMGEQFAV